VPGIYLVHFRFTLSPIARLLQSLTDLVLQVLGLMIAAKLAYRRLVELKQDLTQFRGLRVFALFQNIARRVQGIFCVRAVLVA
jgi:hypothetical protein